MSPPRHISHSLLLPTTCLQVNTSSKPSEPYHHYRSPCHHLAIYLILYYHLLQVYKSTRRQNLRSLPLLQVTMSPPNHISYSLLLPTTVSTGQHVVKALRIILYYKSPCLLSSSLLLRIAGLHVNTSPKLPELYQYHRSPCLRFHVFDS